MTSSRNIVLTGFMGTGKSTVGRLVAERLGRRFVDMDALLAEQFGKPVPAIFAGEGEAAFRVAEAQLCARLAEERDLVIATGGGALVNPASRAALAQSGVLVCLTATADEILRRMADLDDRPLLAGDMDEKRRKVRALLDERRHAYAAIPHQVDTTGRSPEEIAAAVLEAVDADAEAPGMTRIPVTHPQGRYHLCIGEGLLGQAGRLMAHRGLRPGAAGVVSNNAVARLHAPGLTDSLRAAGYTASLCLVPDGEQFKSLTSMSTIYDRLLSARLDRHSAVIGLGGGVVGDMAGFAAATYLRGVPFVQMPTTLLAMVDASVGGKTGVDLPQGKNLVGAFKQPELVVMDTAVLETLPAAEFRAGLAEVIKHGIIGAPELFAQLEEHGPAGMAHLVADAVRVKVRVVEEDPFEQGRRAVLNLGHTFAHALELVSNFALRHGEAVAVGLVAAAQMAERMGRCDAATAARIAAVVERLGLPTCLNGYDPAQVLAAMAHDKKRAGRTLRFVIPQAIGDVTVIDDPGDEIVRAALEHVLS